MLPRMVLIDGNAVAYRQFFARPPESMTNKPVNRLAVFGFTGSC